MKYLLPLIFLFAFSYPIYTQSPPNLTADIPWDGDPNTPGNQQIYTSLSAVAAAFNKARRQEEIQFGLPANILGSITFPAEYPGWDDSHKGLWLLNEERTARGGVDYDGTGGNPPVLGLPLEGVMEGLKNVAQSHANYLYATNTWGHNGAGGSTPFTRIRAEYPLGSESEFMSRAENLSLFGGSGPIPFILERSIYMWNYTDAGSAWGHREANLLQNVDLAGNPGYGYDNNHGSPAAEGIIAFVVYGGPATVYNPQNWGGVSRVEGVIMNIMDPHPNLNEPLPVQLLAFTGFQDEKSIKLHWSTAFEQNNDRFVLERSGDGRDFLPIAVIPATNHLLRADYNFLDRYPLYGINYYRLVQYDLDGKESRSGIISLRFADYPASRIYPSPVAAGEPLTLSVISPYADDAFIRVHNLAGNEVWAKKIRLNIGEETIPLSITQLIPGQYVLILNTQKGYRQVHKFVVR